MNNDETIEVLNRLIQINNDRIEGYQTASEETEEADLKSFFNQMEKTSLLCRNELSDEVEKLGGTPTESTKLSGKFFRVWMDVNAAINGKDSKLILNSCEYGEDQAKDTYKDALDEDAEYLNNEQSAMIRAQLFLLTDDHDKVKAMRDFVLAES